MLLLSLLTLSCTSSEKKEERQRQEYEERMRRAKDEIDEQNRASSSRLEQQLARQKRELDNESLIEYLTPIVGKTYRYKKGAYSKTFTLYRNSEYDRRDYQLKSPFIAIITVVDSDAYPKTTTRDEYDDIKFFHNTHLNYSDVSDICYTIRKKDEWNKSEVFSIKDSDNLHFGMKINGVELSRTVYKRIK